MEKKVTNYSLPDQVCDLLKESIIKGELKPGDRIIEMEIAKSYNVSQAPVREALSRLRKEGFVIHHRHKGTFVSNFSKKNIDEIYSFREAIEPLAIARAIQKIKEVDLKELSDLYQEMLKAGKNGDLEKVREIDVAFHSYIYKLADHDYMYQVWEDLSAVSNRIWYITSKIYFDNLDEIAKLHKPILDALYKRDVEGCIKAFNIHTHYVWEKITNE
ncbi:GntR family transcriptional regulator [Peribacillus sp. NPDC101481]|uniref:GntR family transcriptional regulator n=1 Tax=Peribacillus TaxID=2675229 RepID=UPI001D47CA59|nr:MULTISPECIES: GntR family transcriptional regulator [Peribacillus]MED4096771.1 GntR family transcriptional regulator [Peribacillus simplex]CAH0125619.1 HTH-type transcriptional regulator McbR [Peribacillus sp. Bi134]CAH0311101.1 HTH-type transcriptional regulator McbR [Peribacillus simplex]